MTYPEQQQDELEAARDEAAAELRALERPIALYDLVVPTDGNPLRSGASAYSFAIVASLEPFVLISEHGDMRWSTREAKNFEAYSTASDAMKKAVAERMDYEVCEEIAAKGRQLVREAAKAGVVLTIDQVPQQPLAMRNYETRVSARKAR